MRSPVLLLISFLPAVLAQTAAPPPGEAGLGLGQPAVLVSDPSGNLYASGPTLGSSDAEYWRLPPGGLRTFLSAQYFTPSSFVARVSPSGDMTFWVALVPMSVGSIAFDRDGNLVLGGLASRPPGEGDVLPCVSSETPGHPASFADRAPAVAKLSADGRNLLLCSCVGRGWEFGEQLTPLVSAAVDEARNLYLAGTATGYRGMTATPGAALAEPLDVASGGYGRQASPFAIRLNPQGTAIRYATWLPGVAVEAVDVGREGSLVVAGAASERETLPSAAASAQPQPGGAFLMRSSDAGETWQSATSGLPGPPLGVVVARTNASALLAWAEQWISRSLDGGRTWTALPVAGLGLTPYGDRLYYGGLDDSGQTIYCQRAGGATYRWQGSQWTSIAPADIGGYGQRLMVAAGTALYFSSNNGLWVSTNSGTAWQRVVQGPGVDVPYWLDPVEGSVLYRRRYADNRASYERSGDGGRSWVPLGEAPDAILQFHPTVANLLFLTDGTAVFRSADGGQSWQRFPIACADMSPDPLDPESVLCGGYEEVSLASGERRVPFPLLGRMWLAVSPAAPRQLYASRPTSTDGFLCQLAPDGARFLFCSFLGGPGADRITRLAPDREGGYWIAGTTASRAFPVTSGALQTSLHSFLGDGLGITIEQTQPDAFLARVDLNARQIRAATYFGGSLEETPVGLFADAEGQPILAGNSNSFDLPHAGGGAPFPDPAPPENPSRARRVVPFILRADRDLRQARFAGAMDRPEGIAGAALVDPTLLAYVGALSLSAPADWIRPPYPSVIYHNVPATLGLVELAAAARPAVASFGFREPVRDRGLSAAPGSVVRAYVRGLAGAEERAPAESFPVELAGTQVLVDGEPVPVAMVSREQVNFQLPWTLTPGVHAVRIRDSGGLSTEAPLWVFPAVPVLHRDPDTLTPAAFLEDGSPLDPTRPAPPGGRVRVLFSGGGAVDVPPLPGQLPGGPASCLLPARVRLGPWLIETVECGVASGVIATHEVRFSVPEIPVSDYTLRVEMDGLVSNRVVIPVGGRP